MAAAKPTLEMATVNRNIMLAFLDVLEIEMFEETFSLDSFNIHTFYKWVEERDIREKIHIVSLMTALAARRTLVKLAQKLVGILAHS